MEDHIRMFLKIQLFVSLMIQETGLKEIEARILLIAYHATDFMLIPMTLKNTKEWLGYHTRKKSWMRDDTWVDRIETVFEELEGKGMIVREKLRHVDCFHITANGIAVVARIQTLAHLIVAGAHRPAAQSRNIKV